MQAIQKDSAANQFKLGLNKLVGDICYAHESQVMNLRLGLDKALEFNTLFTAFEWREIAHVCKRLLQSNNTQEKQYALNLLSYFKQFPSELEQDLVQLLINSSRDPESGISEEAAQTLSKCRYWELGEKTKSLIAEYFAGSENESKPQQ